jgi:multiple sugar transport system ATP-binding protein
MNAVRGQISLVENLGMHYLVSVQVQNSQSGNLTLRVLLPSDRSWNSEDISLTLLSQHINWFDVDTGNSLSAG